MKIRLVRQTPTGHRFAGLVEGAEAAARLVSDGIATLKGQGRNSVLVLREERAERDGPTGQGGSKHTYREVFANGPIHTLKRPTAGGYQRWDDGLTFAELREGKLISQATRDKRRDSRSMRGGSDIDRVRELVESTGGKLAA